MAANFVWLKSFDANGSFISVDSFVAAFVFMSMIYLFYI